DRVLAQVRMPRLGANPVVRSLLEPGRRQWKGVQQREAVAADAIGRNEVVGKHAARQRVGNRAGAAEERIRWIEQLAEVAVAHGRRWDGGGGRHVVATPDPFLAPEEKELAAV